MIESVSQLKTIKDNCQREPEPTSSTARNTRRTLRPANFFRSSSVQDGSSNRAASSCGYLDTSSRPCGVLKQKQNIFPTINYTHLYTFPLFNFEQISNGILLINDLIPEC